MESDPASELVGDLLRERFPVLKHFYFIVQILVGPLFFIWGITDLSVKSENTDNDDSAAIIIAILVAILYSLLHVFLYNSYWKKRKAKLTLLKEAEEQALATMGPRYTTDLKILPIFSQTLSASALIEIENMIAGEGTEADAK